MEGPDVSGGGGNHDPYGGHCHNQECGNERQLQSEGPFDHLYLIQINEPDEKRIEYDLKPFKRIPYKDDPPAEVPDRFHDLGAEMARDKKEKPVQEIHETAGFVFKADKDQYENDVQKKQEKTGCAQAPGNCLPLSCKVCSDEADHENKE